MDVASRDDRANFGALPLIYGGILCPPGFPQEGVDTKQTVRLRHGQKRAEYWRVGLREIRQINMDTMGRQLVISLHWAEPGSREIGSLQIPYLRLNISQRGGELDCGLQLG